MTVLTEHDKHFREIKYRCTNPKCGAEQTIRYFPDDTLLPFTCCTACKAGFGKEVKDQAAYRIGMFPVQEVAA
jgi:hypothetical protein